MKKVKDETNTVTCENYRDAIMKTLGRSMIQICSKGFMSTPSIIN